MLSISLSSFSKPKFILDMEQAKLTLLYSHFKHSYLQNFPKSWAELKLEPSDVMFQEAYVLVVWLVNLIILKY